MDKKDLERRLEAAEKQNLGLLDEIKNLKAKLSEMEQGNEIPEYPVCKAKDKYFVVEENGIIHGFTSACGGTRYKYNMFHTESYAQEFAEKCKLIAMMLHCKWHVNRCYVPDWGSDNNSEKCYVTFDHCVNKFQVRTRYSEEGADVYFGTGEAAQKCADWMNTHAKRGDSNDD